MEDPKERLAVRMSNLTIKNTNMDVTKSPSLIIRGDHSDRLYCK